MRLIVFFFQAEDGIRDYKVTGVQTCALPISGMMDCKKALEQTGGGLEKAIDPLRKTGAAKADKRAGREASQGGIAANVDHNSRGGVLGEVNCETDLRGNPEGFKQRAKDLKPQ